jgi:hypothetical protein
MILATESWMNIRRFRTLHAAGATFIEIGRECGCDWRTVRKYLAEDAPAVPPTSPSRAGAKEPKDRKPNSDKNSPKSRTRPGETLWVKQRLPETAATKASGQRFR